MSMSGPQSGTWWDNIATLGAEHSEVIPFGPYLEDSEDLVKMEYSRGFMENMGALPLIFIVLKVVTALITLLVLPFLIVKCFFK